MTTLKDLGIKPEQVILSNGIQLINFRRIGSPLYIKCMFVAGSRFDHIDGISHFLEHLLVAGTKKFPTKNILSSYIENHGGYFNAQTGLETLSINISLGDPSDITTASDILKQIILNPLFNTKTIETERNSILIEIKNTKANPIKSLYDSFTSLAFKNTPLDHSILGSESSLKEITKRDILTFYDTNILNGQIILSSSGDISIQKIEKYFNWLNKLNYSKTLNTHISTITSKQKISITKSLQSDFIHLIYGFKIPPVFPKNNDAGLSLIIQTLAGSRSSILMNELRYKNGLVYNINTLTNYLSNGGLWAIKTSTETKNLSKVINIINYQFSNISKKGLTSPELELTKNRITKSARLFLQTSASLVDFHTYRQFFNNNSLWTIEDYLKKIINSNTESTKKTFNNFINSDNLFLAINGNIDKKEIPPLWTN